MINSVSASTIISAVAAVGLGYCIYFDHKRRHDPEFRKKLRREKRKEQELRMKEEAQEKEAYFNMVDKAYADIPSDEYPTEHETKEQYFIQQLAYGEQLFRSGSNHYPEAAICFFKAMQVYPAKEEIIDIYRKLVPAEVLELIMHLLNKVKDKVVEIE